MDSDENINCENSPEKRALSGIINKNYWLIKIRWIYAFFIFAFFSVYSFFADVEYTEFYKLTLIIALSVLGNILFITFLKAAERKSDAGDYHFLQFFASMQLDFDLVALSLLVYYTGGFDSPVIVMYIFFIIVSTFLIYPKKALRNALTAIILILILFFSKKGFEFDYSRFYEMVAFNVILFFTYLITSYLSRNIRESEAVTEELLKETRRLSVTDGLTDLYNQTYFFKALEKEVARSQRYNLFFSVIIFDVDHFKEYNDMNGHIKGSETLKKIASIMKTIFRSSDILAKYGGDEFVVILPQTDKIGAFLAADRLREKVEKYDFPGRITQPLGKVTLSLGVANYPDHGLTDSEILDKADKALYISKELGRNKTVIYSDEYIK